MTARSITQKIIDAHYIEGERIAGQEVAVSIDQTLTQDATGTMAYLQFEAIGVPRVQTKLSVSYVDHNTLQSDFKNADDHRFLQSVSQKYGLHFSRPGNGICHQLHIENFAETGATTSIFPSDENTLEFLKAQDRGDDFQELLPDDDAVYDTIIDIDLSKVEPLAACPHSPGKVVPVRELAGMKVQQVGIGSCTNSSLKDLDMAAHILEDKTISEDLHLIVNPGSRQEWNHGCRDLSCQPGNCSCNRIKRDLDRPKRFKHPLSNISHTPAI